MPTEPIKTVYGTPLTVTHGVDVVELRAFGSVRWSLEPAEAAALADRLSEEAQNAIHAERLGRRKS